MKVFTDFHHSSLLNSLIMLFEGRLGGQVYRPIGMEWAEKGYWNIYDHPATQLQYLTTDQGYRPIDGTPPLNLIQEVINFPPADEKLYLCRDIESDRLNKAIDFATFCDMDIDIVIASVPQHVEPFKKLIREHMPKAKLIFQIGNAWTTEAFDAPNVMASAKIYNVPENINFVEYHQEFDLNIFRPAVPHYTSNRVYSFINVLQAFPDWPLFQELERAMPDWQWRAFGGQCRDGAKNGSIELAQGMRFAKFIWQVKAGGDGYGHVLFNSAAVGRPIIVKKSYYAGKLGEKLMIDGQTCIDIDNKSTHQIAESIQHFSQPGNYEAMCANVRANFQEQVNFDTDLEKIKTFLERLR